jgi:hypothetical protein
LEEGGGRPGGRQAAVCHKYAVINAEFRWSVATRSDGACAGQASRHRAARFRRPSLPFLSHGFSQAESSLVWHSGRPFWATTTFLRPVPLNKTQDLDICPHGVQCHEAPTPQPSRVGCLASEPCLIWPDTYHRHRCFEHPHDRQLVCE